MAKELRTAPLTAAFGMFVIFTYAVAGSSRPDRALGEAEVIAPAFAPPDENMLLGADQLGRDMFSRIVYGARNTVGLALVGHDRGLHPGRGAGLLAATKGGWFDQFMGRLADVIMSIPSLIFALLMLSALFGPAAHGALGSSARPSSSAGTRRLRGDRAAIIYAPRSSA
jgi:peptide/nickel transport system permease protein